MKTENISRFMAEALIEQKVPLKEVFDKDGNVHKIMGVVFRLSNLNNKSLYKSIAVNYGKDIDTQTEKEIKEEIEEVTKKIETELTNGRRIKLEWVA